MSFVRRRAKKQIYLAGLAVFVFWAVSVLTDLVRYAWESNP